MHLKDGTQEFVAKDEDRVRVIRDLLGDEMADWVERLIEEKCDGCNGLLQDVSHVISKYGG